MYNPDRDTYTISYRLYTNKIFKIRQLLSRFDVNTVFSSGYTIKEMESFCNSVIYVTTNGKGTATVEISQVLVDALNKIYKELRKVAREQNLI